MAENKTSFVLYSDQRTLIDLLSNEQAGKLLKHIYAYVNDENPICEDVLINVAFEPIKQQFKRDLKKWERTKESRSKAGLASAEARKNKQNSTNSTNVKCVQQSSTNSTVNVNDNVNVNVNVNDNVNDIKDNIVYRKFKHLQISLGEFEKLNEVYEKSSIDDILDRIENYKQNTKYSSLYLTANSWLRKDGVKIQSKQVKKNYSFEELIEMEK
jgi:hypothetical protein